MLLKVKRKHFEMVDKPDELFARKLSHVEATRKIHKIKKKAGSPTSDPKEIN